MYYSDQRSTSYQSKEVPASTIINAEFERDDLATALVAVGSAQIDSEIGWIQIFFTGEDRVIFSATGLNISVKYECQAKHSGQGLLKVSGRQLSEYVKQLPPSKVLVKVELPLRMIIKCSGSSARLNLVQDQSRSEISASSPGTHLLVKGHALERWLSSFKDLVLVEDSRFYANGALIWIELNEDKKPSLHAVASDALRLSHSTLSHHIKINALDEGQVIIPRKTLEELIRQTDLHPNSDFELKWSKQDLSFSAESDGYLLFSKSIAGIYPPYEAAFPKNITSEVQIDIKKLLDGVRRALIFVDVGKVLRFIFENDNLQISSMTLGQKEGEELIPVDGLQGNSFEVNYNGIHVFGILNLLKGSKVTMSWESVNKPVRLVGEDEEGFKVFYLLVPSKF